MCNLKKACDLCQGRGTVEAFGWEEPCPACAAPLPDGLVPLPPADAVVSLRDVLFMLDRYQCLHRDLAKECRGYQELADMHEQAADEFGLLERDFYEQGRMQQAAWEDDEEAA